MTKYRIKFEILEDSEPTVQLSQTTASIDSVQELLTFLYGQLETAADIAADDAKFSEPSDDTISSGLVISAQPNALEPDTCDPIETVRTEPMAVGGVRGLLILHCDACGDDFTVFAHNQVPDISCHCGNTIDLDIFKLPSFEANCDCGKKTYGKTNSTDAQIGITCKCGQAIAMVWDKKLKRYVSRN